ncbi:GtrA family protein [Pontibacter diazotrophicus]|uniref:GtrA family protein n=1 Tax=Pontibacter diazotrophicus TaxID=1400979 RepID=A0A3D8LGZ5_9BACT|nr:GtrA family protein [Pontibacter diazotrophicus]RDV16700.1 GtrA family protein [Pontibacter diazotrophicus]
MSFIRRAHKSQVVKFLIVGGLCAAVEFLLFALLVHRLELEYLHANMASLIVAVVLNYLISCRFIFKRGRYSGKVEFAMFVLLSAIGVALNQYLVWSFIEQVELHVYAGKIMAIGLVAVFNYFTKKHIVFMN